MAPCATAEREKSTPMNIEPDVSSPVSRQVEALYRDAEAYRTAYSYLLGWLQQDRQVMTSEVVQVMSVLMERIRILGVQMALAVPPSEWSGMAYGASSAQV